MRTAKATAKLANAVRSGDLKAVASLLAKGADPTRAIDGGGSLLALAEEIGASQFFLSHVIVRSGSDSPSGVVLFLVE